MLVMLLAACARPAAQATLPVSRLEQISQAGLIRVAVAADMPPFAFFDHRGERQGFDIALMTEIARRLGVELDAPVSIRMGEPSALTDQREHRDPRRRLGL